MSILGHKIWWDWACGGETGTDWLYVDAGTDRVCKMDKEPWRDGGSGSETVWKALQAHLLVYNMGAAWESGIWNIFGQDG